MIIHHAFDPIKKIANVVLARKPRFVVISLPRSGSTYFSDLCRDNGIVCSHEAYFTEHGPMLRNPKRRFDTVGDVSWLAPPFLPDPDIVAIHQVRHPMKVIRSIYELGLFDPRRQHTRTAFVTLLGEHFTASELPLRSAVRFYIEWNERCEAITAKRFRIEDLAEDRTRIGEWLNIQLDNLSTTSRTTNRRTSEIPEPWDAKLVKEMAEYGTLKDMAARYGYDLDAGND